MPEPKRRETITPTPSSSHPDRYVPNALKFAFGGAAGMMATCIVQPLDLIKTRMQLAGMGKSSVAVTSEIVAMEGFMALYNGLSAGLLRQATYGTTRLGVFNYLFDSYKERNQGVAPGFVQKTMLGTVSGGIGAFIGTPTEVVLIRMTADGRLPERQRRNYSSVFEALSRIVKEEGVLKLWRGAAPTVFRAMVVNAAQLSTYTQAREMMLVSISDGILLHFSASMVAGLVTAIASLPVDIAKTKIQNAAKGQSQMSVITNLIQNEGVLSLWKGFLPYYARLGPHTVLTFIFLEQMNAAYFRSE
ncbi:mitochondrial 2-oxoglutarate/malate carrier protein-like [Hyposmocoma kahamanoa]|uniref:mitochondrial 2-oxoglutarate/malate carrier protein-like n=1 Tax=Hyposmocoma kahamanoa TaxID=1477025 RepID=UPI000E6DA3FD|nr:mitochondrial 2-oxoglutarate/malate carrier protein-like [Hyposmocoma kahamanoa]